MSCTSTAVYSSIAYCPGAVIAPGIKAKVWFIPAADIESWPTPEPGSGAYASTSSFSLKSSKSWHTIKGIKAQGSAEAAPVGEKPCKSFDVTLNILVPGLSADVVGWANNAANDDLVFAYQEADGSIKVVGYEFGTVDVAPTGNTGAASGDTIGETCAITCNMPYQPLKLSGLTALGTVDED